MGRMLSHCYCCRWLLFVSVIFVLEFVSVVSPLTLTSEVGLRSELVKPKTARSPMLRFHEYYEAAEDAYIEERWSDCVKHMRRALQSYRNYTESIVDCRSSCKAQARSNRKLLVPRDDDLRDLETSSEITKESLCVSGCEQDRFGEAIDLKATSRQAEQNFKDLKPYDYLQLCSYKLRNYQDAAEAAFTYLVGHPGHEVMTTNLQYYTSLPSVNTKSLENLEALPYAKTYGEANSAYTNQDYAEVIEKMEKALTEYLKAEEDCRMKCEDTLQKPIDESPYQGIGETFYQVYQCKQECQEDLNILYFPDEGIAANGFLPSHYHFLQFAYFKMGDLKKASEATEAYLLFNPGDETMVYNKNFYMGLPGSRQEYFQPREEALKYFERDVAEKKFLSDVEAVYRNFIAKKRRLRRSIDWTEMNEILSTPISQEPPTAAEPLAPPTYSYKKDLVIKSIIGEQRFQYPNRYTPSKAPRNPEEEEMKLEIRALQKHILGREYRNKVKEDFYKITGNITKSSASLGHPDRHIFEGFINETICNYLSNLGQLGGPLEKMNKIKKPLTENEIYVVLTAPDLALMVEMGMIPLESLEIFLQVANAARLFSKKVYKLPSVYLEFGGIACRSAKDEGNTERTDLSHNVHTDGGVLITKDGPIHLSHVHRDISCLLYLNEVKAGGNLFFVDTTPNGKVEQEVSPQCGRLVTFRSNAEHYHGVKAVLKGYRCAFLTWLTENSTGESDRFIASELYLQLKKKGEVDLDLLDQLYTLAEHVHVQQLWLEFTYTPSKEQRRNENGVSEA